MGFIRSAACAAVLGAAGVLLGGCGGVTADPVSPPPPPPPPPVNTAPAFISAGSASSPENRANAYLAIAVDAQGGPLSYSLAGGADAALFAINSASGALSFKTLPNFEAPGDADHNNVYEVALSASDGSLSATRAVAITVTDANDAPVFTSPAFVRAGEVTTFTRYIAIATDEDGDTVTFAVDGGADGAAFVIDEDSGVLRFTALRDYEAPQDADANNVYLVTIAASDGEDEASQDVMVALQDQFEFPLVELNGGDDGLEGELFGFEIAAAGGPGLVNLMISAPHAEIGSAAEEAGAAYIVPDYAIRDDADGKIDITSFTPSPPGVRLAGFGPSFESGRTIASAYGANGVKTGADALVAAPHAERASQFRGEAYLVYGSLLTADPSTVDLSSLAPAQGATILAPFDNSAVSSVNRNSFSVSEAEFTGDMTGDFMSEVIIGSRFFDHNGNISFSPSGRFDIVFSETILADADGIIDLNGLSAGKGVSLVAGSPAHCRIHSRDIAARVDFDGNGFTEFYFSSETPQTTSLFTQAGIILFAEAVSGLSQVEFNVCDLAPGEGVIVVGDDAPISDIRPIGDLDQDGFREIVVATFDSGRSAAHVIQGAAIASVSGPVSLSAFNPADVTIVRFADVDETPKISNAGDVDDDDIDDFFITFDSDTRFRKAAYFIPGAAVLSKRGGTIDFASLQPGEGLQIRGFQFLDTSRHNGGGSPTTIVGRVDRDETYDVAFGEAAVIGTGLTLAGRVLVVSGFLIAAETQLGKGFIDIRDYVSP